MAEIAPYRANIFSREQLAQFLKTPELIRAFEALANDVAVILPANEAEITRLARLALAIAAQALMTADRGEPEEAVPAVPGPRGTAGADGLSRFLVEAGDTDETPQRNAPPPEAAFYFGPGGLTTPTGRGPYYGLGFSSRPSVFLEVFDLNSDLVLRASVSGQVRFGNDLGDELFSVDMINDRINCYVPIVKKVYTVATLPPPSTTVPPGSCAMVSDSSVTTFNSVVAGGGANTVPVFVDGAGAWRVG